MAVGIVAEENGTESVDQAIFNVNQFAEADIERLRFDSEGSRGATGLGLAVDRLIQQRPVNTVLCEVAGDSVEILADLDHAAIASGNSGRTVAPVSVLVDPVRAGRLLGVESGARFSDKVAYLFRKQLETADLIVITKVDAVGAPRVAALRKSLEQNFPQANVLPVSLRKGAGLDEWFQCLMKKEHSVREGPEVDRQLLSDGQSSLAAISCTVRLSSVKYFDAAKLIADLATCIQVLLQQEGAEIAHLKMALRPGGEPGIALLNLVRNDAVPEIVEQLAEPIQRGELLMNIRAESDPEVLHSSVTRGLLAIMEKSPELFARMEHCEHFRPARF